MSPPIYRTLLFGFMAIMVVAASAIIASAATLGTISVNKNATATSEISPCSNTAITTAITTKYISPTRYEITSIDLSNIPSQCQGLEYAVTVADKTPAHTDLGSLTGTLPNSSTATLSYTSGNGPNINSINNTNGQVSIILLVEKL